MSDKKKVPTIKVMKKEASKAKFRGARALWLERIVSYDGKPVADFAANVLGDPPSTPKTGALAGKCEPPQGWINFFVSQKLIDIVQ